MKTTGIIALLASFLVFNGCNAQTKKEDQNPSEKNPITAMGDSLHKPDVRVKVNKQFDANGNIIRYDSTYTYFYSSPGGKYSHITNDSLYSHFKSTFGKMYPDMFKHQKGLFYNDSLFKYDFFNDDYFFKRFELNHKEFERMFKEMDSIKGNYLRERYPKGYQKKTTTI